MSEIAASTTVTTFWASPGIGDRSIKKVSQLGKYFSRWLIRVKSGRASLMVQNVKQRALAESEFFKFGAMNRGGQI